MRVYVWVQPAIFWIELGLGLLIDTKIVKKKTVEELNAQLVSLVGEDGAQLLVGALRSRRSISGPETLS